MKRALILPALLAVAACSASPETLKAQADKAFAEHRYADARLHLIEALKASPEDRTLLLQQARTNLALGDGEAAAAVIARIAGGAKPSGELAELAAEAALLRGQDGAVIDFLAGSTSTEAGRLRALVALHKGDMAGAEAAFSAALQIGTNARLLADYARFKLLAGDRPAASGLAARAREASADAIDTLLVSGQFAVSDGDLRTALGHYERATKIYPNSLAALTGKAAVLGDLGRFDEMDQTLARAATFAPKDLTVTYLLARSASARKDWPRVRAVLQPVDAILPAGHPSRLLYAEALLRLGNPAQAVSQLGTILREQPRNRRVRMIAAEAQLATGDAAGALATIAVVADQADARPEELDLAAKIAKAADSSAAESYAARRSSPAAQALLADLSEGDAAIRARDWARAIRAYERVQAATDGRNAMVLNNMAHSQFMVGNAAKARDFAAKAIKQAPDNGSVLDTAGWIEFKTGGDRARALDLLRRAAEKSPANPTIRAHLAEAGRAP